MGPRDAAEIEADTIDGSFVPAKRPEVASIHLDGESVLMPGGEGGGAHWLDATATVVVDLFDGRASIDVIAAEIADVAAVDPATVRNDVLALARTLGRRGVLRGGATESPFDDLDVGGLPLGSDLPRFRLPDVSGAIVAREELRPVRHLLVAWSPGCGYCVQLAPELARAGDALRRAGVSVVLMAAGSTEDNRALAAASGLDCPVLLDGGYPPLVGLGTPSAYLVDGEGRTESALTVGAGPILDLVRTITDAVPS